MRDNFDREINYLRVSVTDRCNLRCVYCVPEEGVELKKHQDVLSFEEIFKIVKTAVEDFNFNKVRLTGGEPLMRRDIVSLVAMLSKIQGLNDLSMTTNGILLAKYAYQLARAGLKRVNVSLDTINKERFYLTTRGGNILGVLQGIDAALAAGLIPLKINCVVKASSREEDAQAVRKYAVEKGVQVRFIKQMDFNRGVFYKITDGQAGECSICNRLRLLSDGRILPCLFSDKTFSTRKLGVYDALTQAIRYKPEKGRPCLAKWMVNIGG